MADEQGRQLYEPRVIAQLFGFSGVRRVEQLTADGVIDAEIVTVNGHKVRRYDLVPTVQKYIAYLSEKAYGKGGAKSERELELRLQKLEADVERTKKDAETKDVKTAILKGEYLKREDVINELAEFFIVLKKFILALPSRLSNMLTGRLDPLEIRELNAELTTEAKQQLAAFVAAGVNVEDVSRGKQRKRKTKAAPKMEESV